MLTFINYALYYPVPPFPHSPWIRYHCTLPTLMMPILYFEKILDFSGKWVILFLIFSRTLFTNYHSSLNCSCSKFPRHWRGCTLLWILVNIRGTILFLILCDVYMSIHILMYPSCSFLSLREGLSVMNYELKVSNKWWKLHFKNWNFKIPE